MIAIQIARMIAHIVLALDLDEGDIIDADDAVQMMEGLGHDIDQLDKAFLRELVDAFAVIAPEYSGEAQKLVRDIPYGFNLEEELAEGDPVRLAELDAIREARS